MTENRIFEGHHKEDLKIFALEVKKCFECHLKATNKK